MAIFDIGQGETVTIAEGETRTDGPIHLDGAHSAGEAGSTASASAGATVVSPHLSKKWARWGVFGGAAVSLFSETLYGMGYYTPPTVTRDGVEYVGDGVMALEAFGPVVQLPGIVLLGLGFMIVIRQTDYDKSESGPFRRGDE